MARRHRRRSFAGRVVARERPFNMRTMQNRFLGRKNALFQLHVQRTSFGKGSHPKLAGRAFEACIYMLGAARYGTKGHRRHGIRFSKGSGRGSVGGCGAGRNPRIAVARAMHKMARIVGRRSGAFAGVR